MWTQRFGGLFSRKRLCLRVRASPWGNSLSSPSPAPAPLLSSPLPWVSKPGVGWGGRTHKALSTRTWRLQHPCLSLIKEHITETQILIACTQQRACVQPAKRSLGRKHSRPEPEKQLKGPGFPGHPAASLTASVTSALVLSLQVQTDTQDLMLEALLGRPELSDKSVFVCLSSSPWLPFPN